MARREIAARRESMEACSVDSQGSEEADDGIDLLKQQLEQELVADDIDLSDYVAVPPDGGWGWAVVAASFMANMVVDGIAYSFGIFFKEFKNEFQSPQAVTALIGSLLTGSYMLVGPIVSGLVNKYGARPVMMVGAIISTVAFLLSSYADNVVVMMVTYGAMGGVGFGFIYLPAIVHCGYYFEKKRALATGISVAGSGVGTFVFAPFSIWLLGEYAWRGSLWIQAGLILNCAVFGSLLRPLKPRRDPEKLHDKLISHEENLKLTLAELNRQGGSISEMQLAAFRSPGTTPKVSECQDSSYQLNLLNKRSTALSGDDLKKFARIRTAISESQGDEADGEETGEQLSPVEKRLSTVLEKEVDKGDHTNLPLTSASSQYVANGGDKCTASASAERPKDDVDDESDIEDYDAVYDETSSSATAKAAAVRRRKYSKNAQDGQRHRTRTLTSPGSPDGGANGGGKQLSRQSSVHCHSPTRRSSHHRHSSMTRISTQNLALSLQRLNSQSALTAAQSMFSLAGVDPRDLSKPMYRKDAFYTGSVARLADTTDDLQPVVRVPASAQRQTGIGASRMSFLSSQISIPHSVVYDETLGGAVSRLVLDDGIDDTPCGWVPAQIRHVVSEMVDLRLLLVPEMSLLFLSNIFGMLGFYVPFVYLTDRAEFVGVPREKASSLLSIIGITNTFGRILFGWMADQPWTTALTINNSALLFCGAITFCVPWLNTYPLLAAYSALFGFVISSYISLTSIILVDLLTLDNLTNSFGLLILSRGITAMIGSPLAGVVYDLTNSYDASFWLSGALLTAGGLVSCTIPVYRRRHRSPTIETLLLDDDGRAATAEDGKAGTMTTAAGTAAFGVGATTGVKTVMETIQESGAEVNEDVL